MHYISSLKIGQRVPDHGLLSNDCENLPDVKSEHESVRILNWLIEKISGEVCAISTYLHLIFRVI